MIGAGTRFLVVGAHALAVHGVARATGDLDVWVDASPQNASHVWSALVEFGAPVEAIGLDATDFSQPDRVIQIGLPPRRIDIMTEISGVAFGEAWKQRVVHVVETMEIPFISREHLVQNKRAAARAKDLADLEELGETAD